jgi:hypothetical protein
VSDTAGPSFDCVDYLKNVLPSLIGSAGNGSKAEGAVIQFVVVDRDDCDLAYRISRDGIAVTEGVADDCNLTLAFVADDVAAFSRGELDVRRALRRSRLRVLGDAGLLEWMSKRLVDARSGR